MGVYNTLREHPKTVTPSIILSLSLGDFLIGSMKGVFSNEF